MTKQARIGCAMLTTQKARDDYADREMRERIFKAGGEVCNVPDVWSKEVIRTLTDTEIFQAVIDDARGCERYLSGQGVVHQFGIASRDPEKATDLVIDTLLNPGLSHFLNS